MMISLSWLRRDYSTRKQTAMSSTIYTGPVFDMARRQFEIIADHLDSPTDDRTAAMSIGIERVRNGKKVRGLFP